MPFWTTHFRTTHLRTIIFRAANFRTTNKIARRWKILRHAAIGAEYGRGRHADDLSRISIDGNAHRPAAGSARNDHVGRSAPHRCAYRKVARKAHRAHDLV